MLVRQQVQEKIIHIILDMVKDNKKVLDLRATTRLQEDLHMDSMAFVQLHMTIEDVFGIRINPDRTDIREAFTTIESLSDMVLFYLETD